MDATDVKIDTTHDKPNFAQIDRVNYPRPQFYRPDYQILNGTWQFQFDDQKTGWKSNWQDPDYTLSGTINVPFPYQSKSSGIQDTGVHETGWYKLNTILPDQWQSGLAANDKVYVHFGAVDYKADVFINGDFAHFNEGGQVPFAVDATPYLNMPDAPQQITVCATDSEDEDQPRGKQVAKPHDMYYTNTSFVWQPVWIEKVPQTHIQFDGFRMTPSAADKTVDFEIPIALAGRVAKVEIEAYDAGDADETVVAATATKPKATGALMHLQFPADAKLWSPDEPNLYNLRIRLRDENNGIIDEVLSYTGLRDIEVKPEGYYINGNPEFLVGPLEQGYWPDTILAAPSGEALRNDVEWTKECGFNTVRKHQKIEDPRYLYWADYYGLMVWSELPNAQNSSPRGQLRTIEEFKRSIARDYNHPSIITWVPANESFDCPGLKDGYKQEDTFQQKLIQTAHQLDKTRPALTDGWLHTEISDVIGIHDYAANADIFRAHYQNFETGEPLKGNAGTAPFPIMAKGAKYAGQPVIITEAGGFMFNSPEESGMGYVTISGEAEYLQKYRELAQAIIDTPAISGVIFTQSYDVECEKNGFQEYDRTPRFEPAKIKAINDEIFNRADILRNIAVRKEQIVKAAMAFHTLIHV